MCSLSGPLGSSLCKVFGHRQVAFTGGLLISLGTVLSAFVPSVTVMYFTLGILGGKHEKYKCILIACNFKEFIPLCLLL